MKRIIAFAVIVLWCQFVVAGVTLVQAIEATCRIEGRGSGCVIDESSTHYAVLTNAHVVRDQQTVELEFWRDGRQQQPVSGTVAATWHELNAWRDIAIVVLEKRVLPYEIEPVTLAVRDTQGLDPLIHSVGCPRGGWPTLFRGRVVKQATGIVSFQPPPAGGRSGSVIISKIEEKEVASYYAVGLIAWRDERAGVGYAMELAGLYAAFDGQSAPPGRDRRIVRTIIPTQNCRNGYCLLPGPAAQAQENDLQFGLFNIRRYPQSPPQQQQVVRGLSIGEVDQFLRANGYVRLADLKDYMTEDQLKIYTASLASKEELQDEVKRSTDDIQEDIKRSSDSLLDRAKGLIAERLSERGDAIKAAAIDGARALIAGETDGIKAVALDRVKSLIAGETDGIKSAALAHVKSFVAERVAGDGGGGMLAGFMAMLGIGGPIGVAIPAAAGLLRGAIKRRTEEKKGD